MNLTMKQFHEALNVHLASMAPDWRVQLIVYSDGQAMSRIGLVHEDGQERSFNFAPTRVDTARANPMHLHRLAQSIAAVIYGFEAANEDPKPAPPPAMCGCGRHSIDPKGDPYAQHREWSGDDVEAREATRTGMYAARGIGVSAPEPAPLVVQDPTGDDVAPDAFTTTGGKSLDDVIEDCRYPRHPDE